MSIAEKTTAETNKPRMRALFPAWVAIVLLLFAALVVGGYRLVAFGPSVLNWSVFLVALIIGAFYLAAVVYLERVAPADEKKLYDHLNHLGFRIEKLEREI